MQIAYGTLLYLQPLTSDGCSIIRKVRIAKDRQWVMWIHGKTITPHQLSYCGMIGCNCENQNVVSSFKSVSLDGNLVYSDSEPDSDDTYDDEGHDEEG